LLIFQRLGFASCRQWSCFFPRPLSQAWCVSLPLLPLCRIPGSLFLPSRNSSLLQFILSVDEKPKSYFFCTDLFASFLSFPHFNSYILIISVFLFVLFSNTPLSHSKRGTPSAYLFSFQIFFPRHRFRHVWPSPRS